MPKKRRRKRAVEQKKVARPRPTAPPVPPVSEAPAGNAAASSVDERPASATQAVTNSPFRRPDRPTGPRTVGASPTLSVAPTQGRVEPRRSPVRARPRVADVEADVEVETRHRWAGGVLASAEPQGLVATYSFDTSGWEAEGPVAIGFVGTRLDGSAQSGDRFERIERLDGLGPLTGKVSISTRVQGVAAGQWRVVAGPVENPVGHLLPRKAIMTETQFAMLAQGPGVRLLAWPILVGLGAVVAVLTQAILLAQTGLPVAPVVAVSLLGCVLGFFGGKAWYLAVNRRHPREFLASGACIQGFLLVALAVLAAGTAMLDVSAGRVLDATAPGIFFGLAVGRPGCFLSGCCAGRPTTSRWGLWSSDRRLAIRRLPAQLYEAALASTIAGATLLLVLAVPAPFPGAVFMGGIAAYTFGRQILFRMRSQSHTRLGRIVVQAMCGVILLGLLVAYVT